jgi:hypothetical protein
MASVHDATPIDADNGDSKPSPRPSMTTIALICMAGAVFGYFSEEAVKFKPLDLNGLERGTEGDGSVEPEWPRPNSSSPCPSREGTPGS